MRYLNSLVIVFFTIILLVSCGQDQTVENIPDNQLSERYISFYSNYSEHSVADKFTVVLQEEIEGVYLQGELSNQLFEIKPKVKGKVQVSENNRLHFVSDSPLDSDTEYQIKFNLSEIKPSYKDLPPFYFNVHTIKQGVSLYQRGMKSYDTEDLRWQYLTGNIRTNDIASIEDVKKILKANQKGKALNIRWDESYNKKEFVFTVDSILRGDFESTLHLEWDAKSMGLDDRDNKEITIYSLNNFGVVKAEVVQFPDQYLKIIFSDPLAKDQNLKGLVTVEGVINPKHVLSGNELRIYPVERISGEKVVEVFRGISNSLGYLLKEGKEYRVSFEELKPEIKWLKEGNIMPKSSDLNVHFKTVNLDTVDLKVTRIFENNILQFLQNNSLNGSYNLSETGREIVNKKIAIFEENRRTKGRWNTYSLDLSKLFEVEPGAMYRIELDFQKAYSTYDCADGVERYNWRQKSDPCNEAYFSYRKIQKMNVLASDLGLIAKSSGDDDYHFYVTNLLTTESVVGAKIDLYDYQKQEIVSLTTDSKGHASYHKSATVFFAVASYEGQSTYLKIPDGESKSLSKFDVSGVNVSKGFNGSLYGERGVWRPGDSLHLTFVLNDFENKLPENHPINFELFDPRGKRVLRKTTTQGLHGFYDFSCKTETDAPTGNWTAKVKVGGAVFSKRLKIETIRPNRLKVLMEIPEDIIYYNAQENIVLESRWLHGAVAKKLKSDVRVSLTAKTTSFEGIRDFNFDDPIKEFYTEEHLAFEGNLNDDGKANFNPNININRSAPGMLKAHFMTKVYENGGGFSIDRYSVDYSPYESYVGIDVPGNAKKDIQETDTKQRVELINLSEKGKPLANRKLKADVYKVEWRWWWQSGRDRLADYVKSSYHNPKESFSVTTDQEGKAHIDFTIPYEEWGRYLIYVKDLESGHTSGETMYVDWPGWTRRSTGEKDGAVLLDFTSDKTKYNVGEEVVIKIPSSANGRALVSIENGSGILDTYWVDTKDSETEFRFKTTSKMAPNVYANVTMIQAYEQTKNDLPIRMYGVIPILVEDPQTRIKPVLNMPDVLEPESEVRLKVAEENGSDMTYTIAMVDEGLLDLTRFKTPDLWSKFYAKQALSVHTWDVFDDILGAYGGSTSQVFSVGGDETVEAATQKKANRFKPMVRFLGPFHLKAGETADHKVNIPQYVGSVRTMVVAGKGRSFGSTEKTVAVKKPLMVLGNLPRVLSPGETVTLPVTVFAMQDDVKDVDVKIKLSGPLKNKGANHASLKFYKQGDVVTNFELDVTDEIGIATVDIEVSSGSYKASYRIEIDVEIPTVEEHDYRFEGIKPGEEKMIAFDALGIKGTNRVQLELSTSLPIDFGKHIGNLIRYPYGCVEQTTSSVFPQLYMGDVMKLTSYEKEQIDKNINAGINRLTRFQSSGGGLSYWPSSSYASEWGTNYAGHFLLEAKSKGYYIPENMLKRWTDFQSESARNWRMPNTNNRNDLIQAYRLYTLALAGKPEVGAMNRLREVDQLSNEAIWCLTSAYALIGQKEIALEILYGKTEASHANKNYRELAGSYGSYIRDRAILLNTYVDLGDATEAYPVAQEISERMSSGEWMSTQTTAYSLMSMSRFMLKFGKGDEIIADYTVVNGASEAIATDQKIWNKELDKEQETYQIKIKNKGNSILYTSVSFSGIPAFGQEKEIENNLTMAINYRDMNGSNIDVSRIEQGTDFIAVVTVSHPGVLNTYDEMALTQVFPSGWEILNVAEDQEAFTGDDYTYRDVRDDRVNIFFDLRKHKHKTFVVRLNASYTGKFYLPGPVSGAMYDNKILAALKGQWIEVYAP